MSSRDIHSRDGGKKVRDLLASFFSTLLLGVPCKRPMYLISPWLSDFKLLDNAFGQFKDLFRYQNNFAENRHILFSETLIEVSDRLPVRIITWPDTKSRAFAAKFDKQRRVQVKFEKAQKDHQKGLLSELFYFEGSMNFTYSGLYVNREKITCNASLDPEGNRKINEAYLEFERIWDNLESNADQI
jgi:hypothetical protein